MKKRFAAQKLIRCLNEKIKHQLNLNETLILGVVLKGLPVAYSLAKMNRVVENFVPIVAQRHIYMQHSVESYFPSLEWKNYFSKQLSRCQNLLVIDDVVNTGFTKQRVESIVHTFNAPSYHRFAALVLNRKNLANPNFVGVKDFFALEVDAAEVECDWGLITVPLWDRSVEEGRQLCNEYFRRFWLYEKRMITVTY
jgi:adenine/guanine phosphoribosyltransferase-like PRPP-binding protein